MDENKNILQKPVIVCLLACLCCFLWGSAYPCVKIGYRLFQIDAGDSYSQLLFAGCRFTMAGILTILIGSGLQKKILIPKKTSYGMIIKLGMVQTVLQYIFFYIGMAHTAGMKGSIINSSSTFISILLACLVFHLEKLTILKFVGCVIGFAGVVIINLNPGGMAGAVHLNGEGFVLGASVCYAMSFILLKYYTQKEDPVVLSGYQFTFGGIIMILIGLLTGGKLNPVAPTAFVLLFYMACLSAVAYSLWGMLLKYNPVGHVSIYALTNPIFGALLSAIILKEAGQFSMLQTLGALACVCVGIYIVNKE